MTRIDWISLSDRLPPDEQFVLLTGDSGYTSTPSFVTVGRRYEAFRPSLMGFPRWLGVGDDNLSDQGWSPTHWAPLPNRPHDLICPLCGRVLSWTCPNQTGEAFCTQNQSRRFTPDEPSPGCTFRGPIRRTEDDEVEAVGWSSRADRVAHAPRSGDRRKG